MNNLYKILLILFLVCHLGACMSNNNIKPASWSLLFPQSKLNDVLANSGGALIDTDDDTVIIMPSRLLFVPNTAEIRRGRTYLLDLIAGVAKENPKRDIIVMAHVANIGLADHQFQLTTERANAITNYLKRYHVLQKR